MSDTNTATPPATAATSTPRRTAARPTVSVRPAAVGAVNAATIAGATIVAAGGGAALAAGAGVLALGATAMGARKKGQAKAKRERSITITRTGSGSSGRSSSGGGGLGRVGRSGAASPGSRSGGSRTGSGRGAAGNRGGAGSSSRGGGLLPKLGRSSGGSAGSGRSAAAGHRRAGSRSGSGSRSPLTAAKVAAARRKIAARRQQGPRLSDAVRSATSPTVNGKKPTAREAFRTARRAVTGDNPKNRGPVRRATAGLIAGGIAAGKAAYDSRQRRRKRDAARQAKQDRIAARRQPQVGTTVRRAAGTASPTSNQKKPAPAPVARRTPTVGSTPAPVTEGMITMTHPLLAISEDFLAAAARNQPEGMLQVTAEAHLLPQVMENIVKAMKIRFDRAQEHPLHPTIKDMYGLVHQAQVAVQQAAEEIGPAIEKVHAQELHRLRNPRVGEAMWDVARNRGVA